VTQKR